MGKRAIGLVLGSLVAGAALMGGCSANVQSVPQALEDASQSPAFTETAPPAFEATAAPAVSQSVQTEAPVPSPQVTAAVSPAAVSFQDAIAVIQEQLPGSIPTGCSLDTVSSRLVWDVEVLAADGAEYETAVDARSGELVYARPEDGLPDVTAGEIKVGYMEAAQTAQALYPDCYLESFSVDRENGTAVYEVEMRDAVGRDHEVILSAQTGEILFYEGGAAAAAALPSYGSDMASYVDGLYSAGTQGSSAQSTPAAAATAAQYRHHAEHGHHS